MTLVASLWFCHPALWEITYICEYIIPSADSFGGEVGRKAIIVRSGDIIED